MARDLITVASVPSRSSLGTTYTVKQNPETGDLSCDCKGWIFSKRDPRSCRHTIVFASIAEALVDKTKVIMPSTPFRKLTSQEVDERITSENGNVEPKKGRPTKTVTTTKVKASAPPVPKVSTPAQGVEIRTTIRTITFEDDDE